MNLYEISKSILACDWFDEDTGEVDFEKKAQFDALQLSFDEKAENIIKYIKNLSSDAERIKEEERRLKERRERKENKAESLRKYLENMMKLSGVEKLDFTSGEARFRKSKPVEVEEEFIKWAKTNANQLLIYKEPTPNKTAIKEAILSGENVQYANITEKITLGIK